MGKGTDDEEGTLGRIEGYLRHLEDRFFGGRGEKMQEPSPAVIARALKANERLSAADKKRLAEEVLPSVNRSARLLLSLYRVPDSQHQPIADKLVGKTRLTTMKEFEEGAVGTASPEHIAINYWQLKKTPAPHPVVLHEVVSHSPEVADLSNHPELTGNAIDHYYTLVHAGRSGKENPDTELLDRIDYLASSIYDEDSQREEFKRNVVSMAARKQHVQLREFLEKTSVEIADTPVSHYLRDYEVNNLVSAAKKMFDNKWNRNYLKKTELHNFEAIERLYAGHSTAMTEHSAALDWSRPAIDTVAHTLAEYAYNLERASGIPGAGLFFIRDVSLGVSIDDAFKSVFSDERQKERDAWFAKGHDRLATYRTRFGLRTDVPNPVRERAAVRGKRVEK